jgi:hypothetical protein
MYKISRIPISYPLPLVARDTDGIEKDVLSRLLFSVVSACPGFIESARKSAHTQDLRASEFTTRERCRKGGSRERKGEPCSSVSFSAPRCDLERVRVLSVVYPPGSLRLQ